MGVHTILLLATEIVQVFFKLGVFNNLFLTRKSDLKWKSKFPLTKKKKIQYFLVNK